MIRIFTLLTISILTLGQGFAQNHVNYNRDSRWFIGLNAGGTWTTQTEVPYRIRGGYGLTFGKSFGMEPDKIFAWDLRARFLHAQFMGQSLTRYSLDSSSTIGLDHFGAGSLQTYQDSLGYFYSNYRTNLLRGSVELVLNTNRLRQNTGWNLSVFGGIGITGYHTATDLFDVNNQPYQYDLLTSPSVSNMDDLQDNFYETDLVGDVYNYKVDWMPSFGFGISKQVLPGVAIGLEHKMTWTRTNLFDGMPNNVGGFNSGINDKYHYTALTLKFHLFNGKNETTDDVNVDDFDTNDDPVVVADPVSKKKPVVDIYDPNTSPYTTTQSTFKLKANIYYVENRSGVTFKQDGNNNTNFSFNPTTDQFESTVILHPGQNLFEITGVNDAGSDYEAVIIIYQKEAEPRNPPIVTITNPPYSPYTTTSSVFGLVSTVLNVDTKSQIQVYLNGMNLSVFSYDNSSKAVNASLNLIEGTNTVTVTASNGVGSDSKTVQIIYKKPEAIQPPIVTFVNPGVDPYYTSEASINIRATALNVASKSDLTILVNGNPVTSFSFNVTTKEIYFGTALLEGANFVEITGVNSAGMDSETTTIIYTRPETPRPPIVTFVDPGVDPITVYSSAYNVTAQVEYVNSASDITLKINGVTSVLFSYSTSSDLMTFSTNLVEGSNVIEIKGVNAYGSDIETTTIIYKRSVPQAPPIVNISYPAVDNVTFASPAITLEASVLNVASAADITVTVNGVATVGFAYNIYTKELSLPLVLVEGTNVVTITGTNVAGMDSKTRIIKYTRPIVPAPPTVAFINPPTSPYVVESADYTITANTTNIDSKSQIVLKQNGVLIAEGLYTFVGGYQIIYNATLIPGSNIFEVSVENAFGADEDLAIINYEYNDVPCVIPTVGYIYPVPYSTVENPAVTIDAQINNHDIGTTVELKLNGVSQGYMTYNAGTSIASKAIILSEGSNAVTVIVTNACGTNQATFTLNYIAPDAPCADPILTPSGATTFTTLESVISLTLGSSNVEAVDDREVKLNGVVVPHTFDAGTGTISIAGLNLIVGVNSVVVTIKTGCGPAILVYTITRDVCLTPLISAVSPISGTSTEASSVVLSGTIANATAGEIVVLLNGVSQAFSYNADTDVLTEALSLGIGSNTISIQVTNACGTASKTIVITRTIPCETIVTNLLSPATGTISSTEPIYTISLHATGLTSPDQISATLNGASVPALFDPISGNITLNALSLIDGENTVVVGMTNACSKASVSYKITYNGCEPPVIVINSIYPGMVVTEGIFYLAVIVTNVSEASDIVTKVNGVIIDFDFNPVSHLLTANFPLLEGGNVVEIIADGCEEVSATASLTYEKPCDKISYSLISPALTSVTALESSYAISLSTFGITNPAQVGVKLNGSTIPFAYNVETKIITIPGFTLVDGINNVVVTLNNECSSEVINYAITYDGCEPPVITLGSNSTSVTAAGYHFEANVSNVLGSAAIQVLLNGAPLPFVFDPSSGGIDANMTLVEGNNTIRIIATGCETTSMDFVVNYSIPCEAITYSLIHPTMLTASETGATYSISLIVQHASAAGISVTKSGVALPFTYIDNVLNVNGIALVDGANNITITLSNGCSSETLNFVITHDDCETPEISLGANPLSSSTALYNFSAIVTNVSTADQIQLKLNGAIIPFTFNPVLGTVNATFTLIEGANAIQLVANGCVTATDNIRVVYSIPCSAVTYSFVSPSTLVSASLEESVSITLNTANVDPATVTTIVNGSVVTHTFAGGVIAIPVVALVEGANTVRVTFGNACSSETLTYVINHEHCTPPVIVINGLADGMVLVDQELVFFASVFNVTDAGEITLKFNGVAIPFEFNPVSKLLQAPITLLDGSNNIEILVDGCESVTGGVSLVYDAPCAAPTYSRVTPTSSSATVEGDTYTITLTTTNVTEEQITVKVNGGTFPFTFSAGTVIITVPFISVPTNSIQVILTNPCGTVTADYSITYIIEEDGCTPIVAAIFGADNRSVNASSDKDLLNVILNLDDGSTQLIEDVTGKIGTFSPVGDKAGRCIKGVWIRSGCNISAAGEPFGDYVANPGWAGTCVEENPCSPITYSLVTPNRLSSSTTVGTYTISFSATNLSGVDDIRGLVNGIGRSVTYGGGKVTMSGISLRTGSNTIQFTLTNDCSTQTITYTISYDPPGDGGSGVIKTDVIKDDGGSDSGTDGSGGVKSQLAPEIIPISPMSTKETVKNQTLNFKAKVKNIATKTDVELSVNGVKTTNFIYNNATQEVSAVINLNAGMNMIKLTATSGLKKELTYYVTYEKSGIEPTDNGGSLNQNGNQEQALVKIPELIRESPATETASTENATYLIKVRTVNVSSKADLTVNVNGVNMTNFTFSSSTNIMSAAIALKEGQNIIRIDANNGGKKASLTYTITYKKAIQNLGSGNLENGNEQTLVQTPELIRESPSTATATTDNSTYLIKVKTVNVMSKADLTLNVNGVNMTNFTFSSSTKLISAAIALKEGQNTIRIDANNGGKKTSLTYTITYKKAVQNLGSGEQQNGNSGGGQLEQNPAAKPVFKLVTPSQTSETVKTGTYVLKTNISNVKSKSDITLTLNSVVVSNFTFNAATGELIVTLTLKSGQNTVRITAKNGDQIATINYTLTLPALQQGGGIDQNGQGSPTQGGGLQQGGVRR